MSEAPKTALVVDDEDVVRHVLAMQLGAGVHGVYWSVVVAEAAAALAAIALFRRGKWKEMEV